LALMGSLYGLLLSGRGLLYSTIRRPRGLPVRVISVGNLTLGGTGKTPATMAIAREAKKRGLWPCILTRGYRGRAKGPCFVTMGDRPLMGPAEAGDEAYMMAGLLRGVPIVKGADRYRAGRFLLEHLPEYIDPSKMLLILDDGFQHWGLKRDVDIVLVDSSCHLDEQRLFPEGRLREPLRALERADIIVLTKLEGTEPRVIAENVEVIKRYNPSSPVYTAYFVPVCLVDAEGDTGDVGRLGHRRVYAFAGIANASHFRSMLLSLGADVVGFRRFRDHHKYTEADLKEIEEEAGGLDIITTEKDMVRLKGLRRLDNLFALRIEFTVERDFYNLIFQEG